MTARAVPGGLNGRAIPSWFTDAKPGIAVHWGLSSVPAFGESPERDFTAFVRDLTAGKDTRGCGYPCPNICRPGRPTSSPSPEPPDEPGDPTAGREKGDRQ
jgi:hypothetical protein